MIVLECVKEPKKSGNITKGNNYTGDLVDKNNKKVKTISEAEYFICINDKGNTFRYFIDLFKDKLSKMEGELIQSCKEVSENIIIEQSGRYSYSVRYKKNNIVTLELVGSRLSCGVFELCYLNSLIYGIRNEIKDNFTHKGYELADFNLLKSKKDIFNKMVEYEKIAIQKTINKILDTFSRQNLGCFILALLAECEEHWPTLDELSEAKDIPVLINPNSDNPNKLFFFSTTDKGY